MLNENQLREMNKNLKEANIELRTGLIVARDFVKKLLEIGVTKSEAESMFKGLDSFIKDRPVMVKMISKKIQSNIKTAGTAPIITVMSNDNVCSEMSNACEQDEGA